LMPAKRSDHDVPDQSRRDDPTRLRSLTRSTR
jgi:hypothetical protein